MNKLSIALVIVICIAFLVEFFYGYKIFKHTNNRKKIDFQWFKKHGYKYFANKFYVNRTRKIR